MILRLFLFFFIFSCNLEAHQPKLIYNSPTKENPFIITDPEISKAFYGKLSGAPHYFKIESDKEFLFYSGILSPKVDNNYKWLSIDVYNQENSLLFKADGKTFNWKPWYEPYARDYYWKGPEIGLDTKKEFKTSFKIDSGTYYIKIFNKNNHGHYSLAVGEAEFFGSNLWEQILTWTPILLYIGPYMDIVHWKKFDIRAYIPHIIIIIIILSFYLIVKKFFIGKRIFYNK